MKTQKKYFYFLGTKIPTHLSGKSRFLRPELRRHHRYTPLYTAEPTEMMLWLESESPTETRYKASIINTSIEGYCLLLRNTQSIMLQVGDIVLLQALLTSPTFCERGSIRWLKQITETDLGLGIHLLH